MNLDSINSYNFTLASLIPGELESNLQIVNRNGNMAWYQKFHIMVWQRNTIYAAVALTTIAGVGMALCNAPLFLTASVVALGTTATAIVGYQFYKSCSKVLSQLKFIYAERAAANQ